MYEYSAKFIRAVDGDTIEVEVDLGMSIYTRQHLRIAGVNAPEISSVKKDTAEYVIGMAAKEYLQSMLSNAISLRVKTYKDRKTFTRYIADVYFSTLYCSNMSVANSLVAAGHATRI